MNEFRVLFCEFFKLCKIHFTKYSSKSFRRLCLKCFACGFSFVCAISSHILSSPVTNLDIIGFSNMLFKAEIRLLEAYLWFLILAHSSPKFLQFQTFPITLQIFTQAAAWEISTHKYCNNQLLFDWCSHIDVGSAVLKYEKKGRKKRFVSLSSRAGQKKALTLDHGQHVEKKGKRKSKK